MIVQHTSDVHLQDTQTATRRDSLLATMQLETSKATESTSVVSQQVDVFSVKIPTIQLSVMLMSLSILIRFIERKFKLKFNLIVLRRNGIRNEGRLDRIDNRVFTRCKILSTIKRSFSGIYIKNLGENFCSGFSRIFPSLELIWRGKKLGMKCDWIIGVCVRSHDVMCI